MTSRRRSRFYALLIGLLVATAGQRSSRHLAALRFYALLIGLLVATLWCGARVCYIVFLCPVDRAARSDRMLRSTSPLPSRRFLCPVDRAARSDMDTVTGYVPSPMRFYALLIGLLVAT